MQVRRDARGNANVPPLATVLTEVQERLSSLRQGWSQKLDKDPSRFGEVEVEVHHAFQELADQVVAGLLAEAAQGPALEMARKKSR